MTVNRRRGDVTLTRATLLHAVMDKALEVRSEEEEQAALDDAAEAPMLAAADSGIVPLPPLPEVEELAPSASEPFIGTPLATRVARQSVRQASSHGAAVAATDAFQDSASHHYNSMTGEMLMEGVESTSAASPRLPSPQKRRLLSVPTSTSQQTSILGQPMHK